jgi:large subunit ribosomal protein L3
MSTLERNVRGLLGTKLGMTQVWDENNRVVPVTVVAAATNVVTQVRLPESDGYNAVQIGYGEIEGRKVTKPKAGHFEKAGVTPRRHLVEIRTADAATYSVGQELSPEVFDAGEVIDVTATSKGKGFAPRAPSARAPRRAGSSRASGWPGAWAGTPSPRRTSPSTQWTSSAG